MNAATLPAWDPGARGRAVETGLWLFMGVVSVLFALFITSYAMRMDAAPDWSPIAMPPQLWLSSALLLAGGLLLQRAAAAARSLHHATARRLLLAGGTAAMAFLGSQLWAWQSLLDARVALAGNPAASFFYLLTALHGLHVIGGLVAWAATAATPASAEPRRLALHIGLCARYWHFLFAVWAVLFATFGWLTPDVVRFICGRG